MVRKAFRNGGGAGGWSAARAAQQSVVQLGVEDREPQAVVGETVEVFSGDTADEPVARSRAKS